MTATALGVERWTDRAAIERFVAASPQGSVFTRPAFLDALDRPWECWCLGPDRQAAAFLFREPDGGVATAPLPFTMYQGILLAAAAGRPAHRAVPERLRATADLVAGLAGESRLSWCLHPAFDDLRALSWFRYREPSAHRFALDLRYTGRIALDEGSGMNGVLSRVRSVRRQEFRKAGSRFHLEVSTDTALLDALHAATFARQELVRPARDRELLLSIAAAAIQQGFGELLVARDSDGTAAGAALFLFDEHTAYYHVAANAPAYRSFGVSSWLFLAGVERALGRGLRSLDVVGMNSPTRGDFKTSFGAVPVPYVVANWVAP